MPHRCLARDSVRPRPRLAARSPIPRRAFGLACVAPVRRPLAARLPSLPTASPGGPPSRPTKTGRSRDVDSRMPELIRNSGGPAAAAQSSRGAATKCACQHRPRSHPGNVCESAWAAIGHRRLTQPGRAGLMPLWSVGGSAYAATDGGRRGRPGRRRRGGKTAQDGSSSRRRSPTRDRLRRSRPRPTTRSGGSPWTTGGRRRTPLPFPLRPAWST
jgi:hypothetical protein